MDSQQRDYNGTVINWSKNVCNELCWNLVKYVYKERRASSKNILSAENLYLLIEKSLRGTLRGFWKLTIAFF